MSTSSPILDSRAIKVFFVFASICSVASLAWPIIERLSSPTTSSNTVSINVIIYLSILVSIAYGILWSTANWAWHWNFDAGGGALLPQGWAAVVLSLCLTIPLLVIPVIYQAFSDTEIVSSLHWKGALWVIVSAGAGFLLLHGISPTTYRGIRRLSMPKSHREVTLDRSVAMEAVYSIVHFGSISLVYRMVVERPATFLGTICGRTLLPATAYFFCMATYIVLRYPRSINDPRGIEARGVLASLFIVTFLCASMYL